MSDGRRMYHSDLKEHKITVKVSEAELELVDTKAKDAGMNRSRYRLVLHGGSHNEERVKSMVSDDFFDYISSEEKIRTAKEILVFLYTLDDQHVM